MVYDLGQNMSGIPQITVQGNRGRYDQDHHRRIAHENRTANQRASGWAQLLSVHS